MTETPNSASAACCATVWQALRIMLQLPDLLGEFLLPSSLPFRIELRFGFRFLSLSTVSPSLLSLSLALCCLWGSGLSLGYYLKSAFVYDNLWPHWYALVGGIMALALACGWTLRKRGKQCYSFDHFYIIFYGLLCSLLGSCFMLSRQLGESKKGGILC